MGINDKIKEKWGKWHRFAVKTKFIWVVKGGSSHNKISLNSIN
jgi:hypothetical protein